MIFTIRFLLMFGLTGLACCAAALAEPVIELRQDSEAVLEDQRLAGNARAQARRRGAIRSVPQLFVYHPDRSPAFHLQGYRENFQRHLELMIEAFRVERSMVDLETLLGRARDANSDRLAVADLPLHSTTIVVYRRADCQHCEQLEAALDEWLLERREQRPDFDPVRIRITVP
ncbi:MAG: hypothetical protein LC637_04070 [Xanthomonadaceae bacterium]|nr:hypothetical protein [Xanthomonadaceae bacterium]